MPHIRPLSGLALLAALALASCGGGSSSSAPKTQTQAVPAHVTFPAGSSQMFTRYARSIGSNGPVLAPTMEDLQRGRQRFGFGVFDRSRKQVTGAPAAVYLQSQKTGQVLGPFQAHEESLAVERAHVSKTVAQDPDAAKSLYVADVKFPTSGEYNVLGLVRLGGRLMATGSALRVLSRDPVPAVGDRPPSITTPTVKSVGGDVSKIDTRDPPDDMHDADFRDVIGKQPVVLLFATPLLCQSRVCGPVTDVTEQVEHTMPQAGRVAFIHMEIYKRNDANKGFRPQVNAFHLPSEPWVFVFDESGRVAARMEGAFSVKELEAAIQTAVRQ